MFFRDKNRQENPDPAMSAPAPAPDAVPAPESAPEEAAARVVALAPPPPVTMLPPAVFAAPLAAPRPAREAGRKKMVVAEGITLRGGDILGCAHLAVEGEAYLTIERCERLEILEHGIFQGSASVGEAEISGYCKGNLVVKGTLRITGTGHVVGSIQYGALQVEAGGRIEGEMKMPAASGDAAIDNPRWAELSAKVSA